MTSNLASEEIADHALQLREAASELARNRYSLKETKEDIEVKETITISRK